MATSLTNDLKRFRALSLEAKRLDDQAKKAKARRDELQAKIWERMDAAGVDSVKVTGTNFVRSATTYASIQDRDQFIEWATKNDKSLLKTREESALLNQLVRERQDNGEPLPPGLGFYVRETIAQRAA